MRKSLIFFVFAVRAFDVSSSIDLSSVTAADESAFIQSLPSQTAYTDYVNSLVQLYSNFDENADWNSEYLAIQLSVVDIDVVSLLAAIKEQIKIDVVAAIVQSSGANPTTVSSDIKLISVMPDQMVLAVCLQLENGDRLRVNALCSNTALQVAFAKCSSTDGDLQGEYKVRFSDASCNVDLTSESLDDAVLATDLAPGRCGTSYVQDTSLIKIRNTVHVLKSSGEEDAATSGKAIPIGCDQSIIVGSIQAEGQFEDSIQVWTDNTFTVENQEKVTRLGMPIYFTVKSTTSIAGISFGITSCTFGTDDVQFEFLRPNGCRYRPLDVKAYDEFITGK